MKKNNSASVQNFIREMDDLNIYDKLNQSIDSNPEGNCEVFLKLIKDVKDKCIPKKVVKYNKKKHKKSKWMTSALLKSINTKSQLYTEWFKTDVNNLDLYSRRKDAFKSCYNTLRRSIKKSKKLYYTRTFAIYKNDIKQNWTIIKDTLHRKTKCELPNQFFKGNRAVTNPDKIAIEFNEYFVNIGRLLSEQKTSPHTSEEYLGDKSNVIFRFTQVNKDCISNIIKKLKSKSSYGYNEISNNLIKHASSSLVKPLTLIVNQVLHTGIFPRQLRTSRVNLVHKSGDQSSFCNYRPIFLLTSMSKTFEYVIFNQLMSFLSIINFSVWNNSVSGLAIQPNWLFYG